MPLLFGSCSKDDDKKSLTVSPSSVTLYSGDTQQLVANGNVYSWKSDNEFVASANNDGKVEASHVGATKVSAVGENGIGSCLVTVKPKYTFNYEPYMKFGASKAEVKAAVKYDLNKDESDELTFIDNSAKLMWVYYFNKQGKLYQVALAGSVLSYPDYIVSYLLERYEVYTYDEAANGDLTCFMGDANKMSNASIILDCGISSKSIILLWVCREYDDDKLSKKTMQSLAKSIDLF